jgi:hypothetical protein
VSTHGVGGGGGCAIAGAPCAIPAKPNFGKYDNNIKKKIKTTLLSKH